ncbi:MAG: 3-methylornithine--L-lysine ligase PylC [Peptococcaceae bacterium]|nr:3-methylornithine--L-lysine ligase PylC [Peptococcaceae bacterium]
MKIVIAGGKLQAVEAVYLARQLGWQSIVVDRNARAPAAEMADHFVCSEISDHKKLLPLIRGGDVVLPALEAEDALALLGVYCQETGTPYLFDPDAYRLSSSKLACDRFFREQGIPAPRYYPEAEFPLIVKPSGQSGSRGVRTVASAGELKGIDRREYVIQEFFRGPSYSVEVIGWGASFEILEITEIIIDAQFDCKAVVAPAAISARTKLEMLEIAWRLAQLMQICGIFDIEVVQTPHGLKVLEIDARLPSQTPISVWHSSGVNMLERLYAYHMSDPAPRQPRADRVCIYKQIAVDGRAITSLGEHILTDQGPLHIMPGQFGATNMITNYVPDAQRWVAAVIVCAETQAQAEQEFRQVIMNIQAAQGPGAWEYREG